MIPKSRILDPLPIDKNKPSFWLLHIVGWLAYVVVFAFENILFTHKDNVGFSIVLPLLVSGAMAALLTLPLRFIYQRSWECRPTTLIMTIALCSLLAAIIWTPAKNVFIWQFDEPSGVFNWLNSAKLEGKSPWMILNSLSYSFFMILVWSSLYFGINYHYRLLSEKQLHLDAVRLSHIAQIKMLRYQINPHFLFNTLNAISTLVMQGNKEKANGMLVRLSTFLRFSLDNDPEKKVRLLDEIKACMLYLEIEKTRFEDRLKVDISVDEAAESLLVPSLLLQPLIENSVKYAIANMSSGGCIQIKAHCIKNALYLAVLDNGPGLVNCKKESPETKRKEHCGVGINNIQDRLRVLYPNKHSFSASEKTPVGYKVEITIPMETI